MDYETYCIEDWVKEKLMPNRKGYWFVIYGNFDVFLYEVESEAWFKTKKLLNLLEIDFYDVPDYDVIVKEINEELYKKITEGRERENKDLIHFQIYKDGRLIYENI